MLVDCSVEIRRMGRGRGRGECGYNRVDVDLLSDDVELISLIDFHAYK